MWSRLDRWKSTRGRLPMDYCSRDEEQCQRQFVAERGSDAFQKRFVAGSGAGTFLQKIVKQQEGRKEPAEGRKYLLGVNAEREQEIKRGGRREFQRDTSRHRDELKFSLEFFTT
ncbi:hypothetical protein M569_04545 [Genlisea aurea]|uniref:Uncharacterized protein n=1 Tax=Genlisea aurea TaxID=192259 RepID=S8CTN8_9LAMI|nr:hypothetical protein M569_04545 [Genlisea aurea]